MRRYELDAQHGDDDGARGRGGLTTRRGTANALYWLIMGEPKAVGCYDYVAGSYEDVCALLGRAPLDLLQRATTSAAARAQSLATSLRVQLAGIEIGVDARLCVRGIHEHETIAGVLPSLRIELTWEAMHSPSLFPSMLAELVVWPLSAHETQIEIQGAYWTPMGPLGTAFDMAVGHQVAEATVHRFLSDLVEQLRCELPPEASRRTSACTE